MRIDIYSDTVCPWCYLGKRRFDLAVAARPQYEPVVVWRPFELNPDVPVEGVDAGGVATGGYASGLAQALVLGLTAAETIAAA